MTEGELQILQNLIGTGTGPAGPTLHRPEATDMMRKGWIEAVKPPAPYLPYVMITPAGRAALAAE